MLNFTVNGCKYTVELVEEDSKELIINGVLHAGVHSAYESRIFIANNANDYNMFRTLVHEITHAYLYCAGFLSIDEFSEETVCEIMAHHGQNIILEATRLYEEIRK